MAFNFVNENPHKEAEFKENIKENDYSMIPKLKSNFHDVFAELEKEMAEDPERKIAFADGADNPVIIGEAIFTFGLNQHTSSHQSDQHFCPSVATLSNISNFFSLFPFISFLMYSLVCLIA